jgi:hypothetical protein
MELDKLIELFQLCISDDVIMIIDIVFNVKINSIMCMFTLFYLREDASLLICYCWL